MISTVPGAVGAAVGEVAISPEQASATVIVTILGCTGAPVGNAVVLQLQGVGWGGGWAYTNGNGVATLSVPAGTYTLQGGYSSFKFSQTITVPSGITTVEVNLGAGCYTISINSLAQAQPSTTPIKPISPR